MAECGYVALENTIPDDFIMQKSEMVENDRHPFWN